MQQAATVRLHQRNIDVLPGLNRETAENGIAVMTAAIHRILTVNMKSPLLLSQVLGLVDIRPMFVFFRFVAVFALNLLQQQQVRVEVSQGLAYVR